jgi:hypothetical protein
MNTKNTAATLSDDYREMLASKHANEDEWGSTGSIYFDNLVTLQSELNPKTILDYGCGKGALGKQFREHQSKPGSKFAGIEFYEYDPAIPEKANDTHQADLVFCTDVMEHIEPDFLEAVLQDLKARTLNCIFFVINCAPAVHTLPDGRNAHIMVQHPGWWLDKINEYFDATFAKVAGDNLFLVARPFGTMLPPQGTA